MRTLRIGKRRRRWIAVGLASSQSRPPLDKAMPSNVHRLESPALPSLRAQRRFQGATARGPWNALSQGLLAMTANSVIHVPQVTFLILGRLLRRRPITTESIGSAATHPSLRGALATKQSRGHNMRGAEQPRRSYSAPTGIFASFAMTDRELAHLFMRVAEATPRNNCCISTDPANMCHPRESVACAGDASGVEGSRFNR